MQKKYKKISKKEEKTCTYRNFIVPLQPKSKVYNVNTTKIV